MNPLIRSLRLLTVPERRQFAAMMMLLVLCSGLETLAVALFFPFLSLLQDPLGARSFLAAQPALAWAATLSPSGLTLAGASGLLGFFAAKNTLIYFSIVQQSRVVYGTQASFSGRLLSLYLNAPWPFHLRRNPAELLRNLTHDVSLLFGNVISPYISLMSEGLVTILILGLLLAVDPVTSILAIIALGGFAAAFYRVVKRKTDSLGRDQQRARGGMIRWVNQSLGGTKEIRVLGREQFFVAGFTADATSVGEASIHLNKINQSPRLYFETLLVAAIALAVAAAWFRGETGSSYLPTLGLMGAAAFRLLPAVNRIVATSANIRYHRSAVDAVEADVVELTSAVRKSGPEDDKRFEFRDAIVLDGVSYRYETALESTLRNVTVRIPRGTSVALEGRSGAGKTTLVDIILGLLPPTEGRVLVDGRDVQDDVRAWHRTIGYIPQTIYLSDASIRANVAFGVPLDTVDETRVLRALCDAQLMEVVNDQPEGLDTEVGERGVRLSGGQRQRLAIARALYHDPDVLVLDEATASLDDETEREIVAALNRFRGKKTILVISHRPSTTEHCDIRLFVEDGFVTVSSTAAAR